MLFSAKQKRGRSNECSISTETRMAQINSCPMLGLNFGQKIDRSREFGDHHSKVGALRLDNQ